jgi:hypothetical protein
MFAGKTAQRCTNSPIHGAMFSIGNEGQKRSQILILPLIIKEDAPLAELAALSSAELRVGRQALQSAYYERNWNSCPTPESDENLFTLGKAENCE